jgi:hypothetical protein
MTLNDAMAIIEKHTGDGWDNAALRQVAEDALTGRHIHLDAAGDDPQQVESLIRAIDAIDGGAAQ